MTPCTQFRETKAGMEASRVREGRGRGRRGGRRRKPPWPTDNVGRCWQNTLSLSPSIPILIRCWHKTLAQNAGRREECWPVLAQNAGRHAMSPAIPIPIPSRSLSLPDPDPVQAQNAGTAGRREECWPVLVRCDTCG